NGRRVHDLPATASWRDRIGGLFGQSLADRLIEIEARDGDIALRGFVGRPEDDMASTRLQHLFVAGRPFRDRPILHAVQEAYRGVLLSGRQPIVFLAFELPPDTVDVNVHPAKMEVRFREPSRLYRLVLSALRTKFLASDMRAPLAPPPVFPWDQPGADPAGAGASSGGAPGPITSREMFARPAGGAVAAWFGSPEARAAQGGNAVAPTQPAWERDELQTAAATDELAVQMHDRYIVVESGEGIEVIDQHALHERVLYERLKEAVANGALEVQPLLIPERIDLVPAEIEIVTEHAEALAGAGMRVEPFGGATVIVTSKPALVGSAPAATLLREVIDRLASTSAGAESGMIVDEVLHGLACKAAIKAGDPLSQAEVDALVRDRRRVRESHHCPHGRPTSLTLSRQELDRQFRRT
ncbi:MAG: hypothetical protein ACKOHG_18675, partial [Planctomycetia bacterium]